MNSPLFETGDRILVNSRSFLSRSICFFMRWWARKKHLNPEYTYSHAGTILVIYGEVYVAESVENGFRIRKFDSHYHEGLDMIVVRCRKEYTGEELHNARHYAIYLQEVNNFYQYWGLLQWIILIVFNINTFGRGTKFSNYCYEGAYRIAKQTRPEEFPKNPELVTCFDLYNEERDKIVYQSTRNEPTVSRIL